MFLPKIQQIRRSSRILNTFGGINRQESASVNEFADALNMSAKEFPCVAVRPKRRRINMPETGQTGIINNNGLYLFRESDGISELYKYDEKNGKFRYIAEIANTFLAGFWECNKDTQSLFLTEQGLCSIDFSDPDNIKSGRISREYVTKPKYISSMTGEIDPNDPGDYCRMRIFFEDGTYISNYNSSYEDYDSLMSAFKEDKSKFETNIIYFVAAAEYGYKLAYRKSSDSLSMLPVESVVLRFLMPENIGPRFNKGDYICVEGMWHTYTTVNDLINRFHEVIDVGSQTSSISDTTSINEIFFDVRVDVCDAIQTIINGYGGLGYFEGQTVPVNNQLFLSNDTTISLKVPELACICEAHNRIWGASNEEHSIYCCALGEVNNWYRYEGISSDSWAATVGSEGEFTACVSFNGQPIFFKENEMIIVTGSRPASYSLVSYDCPGVVKGAGNKTCVHRGSLFYVSRDGVYSYTSSGPICISSNLCDEISNWSSAGIFCHSNRLYVMFQDATYVYDLVKRIWHKEDKMKIRSTAITNEGLVYVALENNANDIIVYDDTQLNIFAEEYEEDIPWYLETKTLGNDVPAKKYLAQIDIALELKGSCTVLVKYDSGEWIRIREFNDDKRKTEKLCFYPRRSDHFKLRLEGVGYAKIFSITQTLEEAYENG